MRSARALAPRLRAHELTLSLLAIVGAILSIQVGAAIAKMLFAVFGASGTTAIRLILGSLLLCAFFRPWRSIATWRDPVALRLMLVYGASLGVMNLLFYVALRGLPLGIAVSIEFLGPLGVAVLASRRVPDFLWAGLAILGLTLLLPVTESAAQLDPWSMLAALGAAVGWALYIVVGQKLARRTPGVTSQGVALGMVIGALVVMPVGLAEANASWLDARWLLPALLVALLSTAIPYPLEMRALRRLPMRTFGILMSLEPAIAALAGWLLLGERLTATQQLAIGCVMIASAGTTFTARSEVQA